MHFKFSADVAQAGPVSLLPTAKKPAVEVEEAQTKQAQAVTSV